MFVGSFHQIKDEVRQLIERANLALGGPLDQKQDHLAACNLWLHWLVCFVNEVESLSTALGLV